MLRDAVLRAADRSDVRQAVLRIYADLQAEIDRLKPRCSASGRCCRFEEYGHRLYVTTAELALFVRDLERLGVSAVPVDGGCPYQRDGLCGVHPIRPFGCRVFFCDPSSEQWQHEQYERFHGELKRLHERLEIPYLYVEWRAALGALDLPPAALRIDQRSHVIREAASTKPHPVTSQRPGSLSLPQLPF